MGTYTSTATMGNSLETLRKNNKHHKYPKKNQIQTFSDITYFSVYDIERLFLIYADAAKRVTKIKRKKYENVPFDYKTYRIPLQCFSYFEYNPFLPELAQIFSTSADDPSDGLIFTEFLDLMNVLHPPDFDLKAHYAFQVFCRVDNQSIYSPKKDDPDLSYTVSRIQPRDH